VTVPQPMKTPQKHGEFTGFPREKWWFHEFDPRKIMDFLSQKCGEIDRCNSVTKMNRHVGFHLSKRWKIGHQGETGNFAIQAYQWFWVESNPLHSTRVYGRGVVQNMGRSRYLSMSTLNIMTWGLIYSIYSIQPDPTSLRWFEM
jgi:hypothetical protein